ncbi:AAA family ATPase [Jannaschia ovalis]|uniref:AAA family ATPase n=1 Tax=Jannaschia ovalis TaxID=3038773 RepID=A0ABY8LFC9_9RHOB|nr:AAA family ATPase [Jannaschia sp. GRR-S6-38]WGH79987.1 AAA family ATPase [Jannaschia sp. GRR-S6-38]
MTPDALADRIRALPGDRVLVALVGPPGAGKSTLSDALLAALGADAALVPMDGFHLDDRVLEARGLLPRKGAPETFDIGGLRRALQGIRAGEEVVVPVFDRAREIAIAGARVIPAAARVVLVEGNWLLLDRPGWRDLGPWDLTVRLDVPEAELRRRLEERWAGLGAEVARAKIEGNDLPNARTVRDEGRAADVVIAG